MLRDVLSGLLDLLSPPACAACSSLLDARSEGFCAACRLLIEPIHEAASPADDRAACWYGGPLRDALQRLKYAGASELAPRLASLLRRPAESLLGQVDCVAVVPLHPRRLRQRGYNQSALLASPVARLLGVPFQPTLLTRVRDTPAQVGKSRNERTNRLAHAFRAAERVRGRAVLVIDDVRTTGATFHEARRALHAAAARAVFTLSLARTPDGDNDPALHVEPHG